MTYLAKAAELIKEFEGLRLKAYRCPANVLTEPHRFPLAIKLMVELDIPDTMAIV